MKHYWVYILLCADGSYYTGSHRGYDLDTRVNEHQQGIYPNAYTATRRPVELIWAADFPRAVDAITAERQIKGWSREKKEAMINGEWDALPMLSKRGPTGNKKK